jgi:dTDP-4-dehydrorhamnose reductase
MQPIARVLVTGASGLLGAHLVEGFRPLAQVIGMDRNPWWGDRPLDLRTGDMTDRAFLQRVVADTEPDVVIHCAALVNVDRCEQDPAAAYSLNADTTRALARAVRPGTLIVYVSTDSVFKGDRPFSTEADLPCPRTVYARSKLQGEWEAQLASPDHLIVRTNFYGWSSGRKTTAAEWLFAALRDGQAITLFDDVFFTPIYVGDLVERVRALVLHGARGLFHVAGRDRVSKFEFGQRLADAAGLSLVHARRGSIETAGLAADRPRDMSIASSRLGELVLSPPGCADGLQRFWADRSRGLSQRIGPLQAVAGT